MSSGSISGCNVRKVRLQRAACCQLRAAKRFFRFDSSRTWRFSSSTLALAASRPWVGRRAGVPGLLPQLRAGFTRKARPLPVTAYSSSAAQSWQR